MILTSGCFDGIHAGHIAFLQKLHKITGQHASVAVAPDAYIRQVKGREPKWPQNARLKAVSGLKYVADVFLHGPTGAEDVISGKYRAFAKGMDHFGSLDPRVLAACATHDVALIFVESGFVGHNSD